jgi:hypothetical protein
MAAAVDIGGSYHKICSNGTSVQEVDGSFADTVISTVQQSASVGGGAAVGV